MTTVKKNPTNNTKKQDSLANELRVMVEFIFGLLTLYYSHGLWVYSESPVISLCFIPCLPCRSCPSMYVLPTPPCLSLRVPHSESYSCLCVSLNCAHVLLLVFHSPASSIRLVLMSASVLRSLGLPCVLVCILFVSCFILTVCDPVFTVLILLPLHRYVSLSQLCPHTWRLFSICPSSGCLRSLPSCSRHLCLTFFIPKSCADRFPSLSQQIFL